MKRLRALGVMAMVAVFPFLVQSANTSGNVLADESNRGLTVQPYVYDPGHTNIIVSQWVKNLGLPDPQDRYGLLMSKNGPTPTNAAAGASVTGVKGITVTELGFDRRYGGHCGAGAPRFDVVTDDNVDHFFGCVYGIHTPNTPTQGWERIRFAPADAFPPVTPTEKVKTIDIIFDEGTDTGPDFSGMVVLDNIDINGKIVGAPSNRSGGDGGDGGQPHGGGGD